MTNWQASKCVSLIALQNDVAKNSLRCSAAVKTPRYGSSATTQNKGKAPRPMSSYKRPHGIIGQISHDNHGSFGGNRSKGASNSKVTYGYLKDAKADLKIPSKSYIYEQNVKRERATSGSKSYDSWNKAKVKFNVDEFNKPRRTNACMNCGEVGQKFFDCSKPKP